MVASVSMGGGGRWSPEVLMVAGGIVDARGIPHRDALDIARRRVARWGGRVRARFGEAPAGPVDLAPGDACERPAHRRMLLTLGDASAWVWARRC